METKHVESDEFARLDESSILSDSTFYSQEQFFILGNNFL